MPWLGIMLFDGNLQRKYWRLFSVDKIADLFFKRVPIIYF
jgi:hypothetical protein